MDFPLSNGLANRIDYHRTLDSTNLELARQDTFQLPEFSVVVAGSQSAGQGRLGRTWASEPGTSLSASILLRPKPEVLNWITLTAGIAMAMAIRDLGPKATVKWPNDVLIAGKKVSGILAQLRPDGSVILGVGLNLKTQQAAPETATSLSEHDVDIDIDNALAHFLAAFRSRYFVLSESSDLGIKKSQTELREICSTLGTKVRAEFPDSREVIGTAIDIDTQGQLILETPERLAISAADIWHLRN